MQVRHALSIAAVSAFALLGACSKPATETPKPTAAAEAPISVKAPSGVYKNDPYHTTLTWTLNHLGTSNYTAEILKTEATLTLDAANPTKSAIELTINPANVSTNFSGDFKGTHPTSPYKSFDEEIAQGEGFLNGGKFPTITFKSTAVEQTGPKTANVTGDLTFLGVTKPVTVQAEYVGDAAAGAMGGPVIGFSAVGKFKRSDFGMAKSPLGDEVTIRYDAAFQPAKPAA
jgi:polyisoprenoid-binding protein YceI